MTRGKTYWMIATSLENFRISRDMNFAVQGMKSRERRKARRIEPGDRLLFYVTGIQGFGASATVTSKCFEDREPLWNVEGSAEDYPWRVNLEPTAVLAEEEFLDARELGPRLEYVRKWPPEYWLLAFQGNLHVLPKNDFELLEQEMQKVLSKKRAAGAR